MTMDDVTTLDGRDLNGRWQPGVSGNPGGRPSLHKKIAGEIRVWIDERGKTMLIGIAEDKDGTVGAAVRVSACRLLFSYALGQPHQSLDINAGEGNEDQPVDLDEIRTLYESLVAQGDSRSREGQKPA